MDYNALQKLKDECEYWKVETKIAQGQLDKVRQWTMINEIAQPPLDWEKLGQILSVR